MQGEVPLLLFSSRLADSPKRGDRNLAEAHRPNALRGVALRDDAGLRCLSTRDLGRSEMGLEAHPEGGAQPTPFRHNAPISQLVGRVA
jgi:hypothetical protein